MKKKSKVILKTVAVILVIAVLSIVGFIVYLGHTWNENHKFGDYVITEGPWGSENTWVSDDGNSYLVGKMEPETSDIATVTAYFKVGGSWQQYELHMIDRIAYLDRVEDGITVEGNSGDMKFDGTTFTIKGLDETRFGNDEYSYTVTNEEFKPN